MVITRDDAKRRFIVAVSGQFTPDDARDVITTWHVGVGQSEPYRLLVDAREAVIAGGKVAAFAAVARPLPPDHAPLERVAIVASTEPMFSVARLYELWTTQLGLHTVCAVQTMEAAERWLTGDTPPNAADRATSDRLLSQRT